MIIHNRLQDITLISIDCGNSYITYYMLKSLFKINSKLKIIILCIKDNNYLDLLKEFENKVEIIKLFNDKNIEKYLNDGEYSACHSYAIKYLVDNYITSEYFLLCDNDIIFSNLSILTKNYRNYDIIGYYDENYYNEIFNILHNMEMNNLTKYSEVDFKNVKPFHFNCDYKKYSFYSYKNMKVFLRYVPYYILIKTNIFKKYFSQYIVSGKHKNNYYYIDTLSLFTFNILKNKCKILNFDITNDILHIGNSTNKYSKIEYEKKLNTAKHNTIYT